MVQAVGGGTIDGALTRVSKTILDVARAQAAARGSTVSASGEPSRGTRIFDCMTRYLFSANYSRGRYRETRQPIIASVMRAAHTACIISIARGPGYPGSMEVAVRQIMVEVW